MINKIRWGLISTANINKAIIPAIRASQHGELVAVASRAQHHGFDHLTAGIRHLLPQIDQLLIPVTR
ncbi:MAG: hypothetical protein KJ638_14325 [Chloroflexi bacterium]|nr:hypothetical protein [Chloroflexota bacterium]